MKKYLLSIASMIVSIVAFSLELAPFGEVKLVDSVNCAEKTHHFDEYPVGASKVVTLLGEKCRWMDLQKDEGSFFSYRLGEGKGLKADGAYVVVIEYPDDLPRTYLICNEMTASRRSFGTGRSTGDCFRNACYGNHLESLDIPQSGKFEKWMAFSTMPNRTADWKGGRFSPEEGFNVLITQYARQNDPISAGIAVKSIKVYEILDEKSTYVDLNLPKGLPHRNIFWREEMSDWLPWTGDEKDPKKMRTYDDRLGWIRAKARQMKFLGMNTYTKDLLEFGHVQHWDPNVIRLNWAWSGGGWSSQIWEGTVKLMGGEYGFTLLPYYEWAGNFGADYQGKKSYGYRRVAETLGGEKHYTHIWWSEKGNIDITDPEALEVTKELLQGSLLRFKNEAKFIGAIFRPRIAAWPIGFGDSTRARFAKEANGGKAVSRQDLKTNKALYGKYLKWWSERRAQFVKNIQEYLESEGIKDAVVIYENDGSEQGNGVEGGDFCVDNVEEVANIFRKNGVEPPMKEFFTLADSESKHMFLNGRDNPSFTWGKWEWQHAGPMDYPETFKKYDNIFISLCVNRLFSVNDPLVHKLYENKAGVETIIRHYSLNEHMQRKRKRGSDGKVEMKDGKEQWDSLYGYSTGDFSRAGRASMMVEVESMAKGNPVNIGYLLGQVFARGYPIPAREFNRNFLALPALPSKLIEGACEDKDVYLREIDCSKYIPGKKYYALVHTGWTPKKSVRVKFPGNMNSLKLPAYDKSIKLSNGVLEINLRPWQLLALEK